MNNLALRRCAAVAATMLTCIVLAGCGSGNPFASDSTDNRTAAAPADLTGYVGRHPFERISGTTFLSHPLVESAVARAAPSATVARTALSGEGPSTPIVLIDGKLHSWGCEQSNCGPHNWTIIVAPDGSSPELCYHDEDSATPIQWFVDGAATARTDPCPSEA